jgi:hypothetical protein
MDISELSFFAEISDGYSFRNLMCIIKNEVDVTHLVATPKGLEISFVNTARCNCHQVYIDGSELSSYIYNFTDNNGKLQDFAPMAFETSRMMINTRGIGRKDIIIMYKKKNEDKICINPIKTDSKSSTQSCALFIDILNVEFSPIKVAGEYSSENVKVPAKDFSTICSQVNTSKCSLLKISGCSKYVIFEGILPNNTVALTNKFFTKNNISGQSNSSGGINDISAILSKLNTDSNLDMPEIKSINLDISSVKALSKIHNVSPQHTQLKFYFSENTAIRMESPIGMYGRYYVFMRSSKA